MATTRTPAAHGARRPSRRTLLLALGLAAAAAVVLAVWWASGDRGGTEEPGASTTPTASAGSQTPSGSTATEDPTAPAEPTEVPPSPATLDPAQAVAPESAPGPDGRPTSEPVPLAEPATPGSDLVVRLASTEAVEGISTIPGEVAGPALRLTVEVTNGGTAVADLTGAVVNVLYGADRVPATSLLEPGARPLPTSVEPGQAVTGVWVFTVPVDQRADVVVEVDLAADVTVLVFGGAVEG